MGIGRTAQQKLDEQDDLLIEKAHKFCDILKLTPEKIENFVNTLRGGYEPEIEKVYKELGVLLREHHDEIMKLKSLDQSQETSLDLTQKPSNLRSKSVLTTPQSSATGPTLSRKHSKGNSSLG